MLGVLYQKRPVPFKIPFRDTVIDPYFPVPKVVTVEDAAASRREIAPSSSTPDKESPPDTESPSTTEEPTTETVSTEIPADVSTESTTLPIPEPEPTTIVSQVSYAHSDASEEEEAEEIFKGADETIVEEIVVAEEEVEGDDDQMTITEEITTSELVEEITQNPAEGEAETVPILPAIPIEDDLSGEAHQKRDHLSGLPKIRTSHGITLLKPFEAVGKKVSSTTETPAKKPKEPKDLMMTTTTEITTVTERDVVEGSSSDHDHTDQQPVDSTSQTPMILDLDGLTEGESLSTREKQFLVPITVENEDDLKDKVIVLIPINTTRGVLYQKRILQSVPPCIPQEPVTTTEPKVSRSKDAVLLQEDSRIYGDAIDEENTERLARDSIITPAGDVNELASQRSETSTTQKPTTTTEDWSERTVYHVVHLPDDSLSVQEQLGGEFTGSIDTPQGTESG